MATPRRGSLTLGQVRGACKSPSTKRSYVSYLNGVAKWIRATQQTPERFFRDDGAIDVTVFTPGMFDAFLVDKLNGNELKVSTLSGYRSAIKGLYTTYRVPMPPEYHEDLKQLFKGMNRIEAEEAQEQGELEKPGKQPLPYSLYAELCQATLPLSDGGFAHLFLTTQWNLMCRSKSVETIHITRLHAVDDSIGCVLHKTKTNQEGSGPKDPRHMYANPFSPATCWVLALGLYLACNPTMRPGKLFPGKDQEGRFSKSLNNLLNVSPEPKTYGTHSIRKGVATFSCSASTGGPSIVSVCLRCGWSLGGVQDRYFRYEAAGDQYLGRVVAGLPINSHKFAARPPHFQNPKDATVQSAIDCIFPEMSSPARLYPMLQLCLASLVEHSGYLRAHLPRKHPFRSSYLWCNPTVLQALTAQLNCGADSWMRQTGIPPHVRLYMQQQQTQEAVEKLPDLLMAGFAKLLDQKHATGGGVSAAEVRDAMKTLLQEAGLLRYTTADQSADPERPLDCYVYHWKSDGKLHRLPEDFEFPQVDTHTAWRLWWFGNAGERYPPFRRLHSFDFPTKVARKTYSEWGMLVKHISEAYKVAKGIAEMVPPNTIAEADEQFALGIAKVPMHPPTTQANSKSLRAVTVLRRIRVAIHSANPNARVVPFRKRKRAKKSNSVV